MIYTSVNYKKSKRTESDLVCAICDYLKIKGYFVWRQNNMAVYDAKKKTYRKMPKHCINGVSDIFMIDKGQFYAIEAKLGYNKPSDYQKIFAKNVQKNGGIYLIVKSVDDLIEYGL